MHVFLETDRLVLRRFTMADAGLLTDLDADPDVMRFITGGAPTSREEIETEFLPAFLGYYRRYPGYGFWAAIEKSTGDFLAGFISGRRRALPRTTPSSATGSAGQPGVRGTPLKGRAR